LVRSYKVALFIPLGRKALDLGHSLIKPGITTEEIDQKVHEYIVSQGAYPSPLNYNNFPKSLCTYQ